MIKERRKQLMHIYKLTQELSNLLWMGLLSGDEEKFQQDIDWAKQIPLQIAEGLFGYTGTEEIEVAKALRTMQAAQDRRGGIADTESQDIYLELVSRIVTAYVSNNIIPTSELPGLIRSVHNALPHTEKTPVRFRKRPAKPKHSTG